MPKLKLATLEVVGSIWFSHIETLNSLKSTPPTPTAHTPASCVCLWVPLVLPLGLWLSSGHRRRRSLLYKFMRSGAIWWPGWGGRGRGQLLSSSLSCGPGISMAFLPFFTCPPTPYLFLCTGYSAVYLLESARRIGPQISLTQSNRLLCANLICRSIAGPWVGPLGCNAQPGPIRSLPCAKASSVLLPLLGNAGWIV